MESNKQIKRIKTIGVVLIILGSLMVLSNLPAMIFINLIENFSLEVPYIHPIYFILNGILLMLSGFFLKLIRKIGIALSLLSALVTIILIASLVFSTTMIGEFQTIIMIGSVFFIFMFLIPVILMARFLLRKDIKRLFD